jgi:putative restriction endonuclease
VDDLQLQPVGIGYEHGMVAGAVSMAWQAFGEANGAASPQEMRARIAKYRKVNPNDRSDFEIGCRILTRPFFFSERDWIPVAASWSPNIVSFKTYNTSDTEGSMLRVAATKRERHPRY